jgi:hypothetical protein
LLLQAAGPLPPMIVPKGGASKGPMEDVIDGGDANSTPQGRRASGTVFQSRAQGINLQSTAILGLVISKILLLLIFLFILSFFLPFY